MPHGIGRRNINVDTVTMVKHSQIITKNSTGRNKSSLEKSGYGGTVNACLTPNRLDVMDCFRLPKRRKLKETA